VREKPVVVPGDLLQNHLCGLPLAIENDDQTLEAVCRDEAAVCPPIDGAIAPPHRCPGHRIYGAPFEQLV
jgi:hypothetical protein